MTIHPRRKQAIAAFPSGATVIVDLNCPSSARAARTSPAPFRLNAFEQLGVGSIQVVSKFHRCLQSFGIHLETFPQFPGRRIVKERNVLIQIRHN
jgi:hypothetical protein